MMILVVTLAILTYFASFALASTDPIADPSGFFETMVNAFASSNYKLVAILGILLFVSLIRAYGSRVFPILGSGKAAFVLSLVVGALTSLTAGLMAGTVVGSAAVLKVMFDGVLAALAASGMYSGAKKLAERKM